MKTEIDEALRGATSKFRLRYACEDCAHFVAECGKCAEGYPNAVHRERRIETSDWLEFCKSFELV